MSDKRKPAKADRLAEALRANLKRRKAQARAKGERKVPSVPDVPPGRAQNNAGSREPAKMLERLRNGG